MSFYSSIDRRINADRWFRALSHMGQWLWFRLLTGPHVTPVAGLWPATEEQLAKSFNLGLSAFRRHYAELAGKPESPTGKIYSDWSAGVIWFPRAIHVPANQPRNENSLRGWSKHIELVPECQLRDVALNEIIDWVELNSGEGERFPRGLPDSFPLPAKRFSKPTLEQLNERLREQLPEQSRVQLAKHVPRANQDHDQDRKQEQEPSPQPPPRHPNFIACPGDLRLTDDQRGALETSLIPGWAIDIITAGFVAKYIGDPDDKRTLVDWRKGLATTIAGRWNNPQQRPKKPSEPANDAGIPAGIKIGSEGM